LQRLSRPTGHTSSRSLSKENADRWSSRLDRVAHAVVVKPDAISLASPMAGFFIAAEIPSWRKVIEERNVKAE
jgi:hypothetical protein